jgi:hypothetical protein
MKILIDPTLAVLAKDLSTEDKAELLMCILEYPARDCELGLWKYMRQQIDLDAQKYREKCDRAAAIRQRKSELKSDPNLDLFSSVKEEDKENINKENVSVKERESSNALTGVENPVDNFRVSENFSFYEIGRQNPKFAKYLALYLPAVVERANKTIIQKWMGKQITMSQILNWLDIENGYYKQNHRGQP